MHTANKLAKKFIYIKFILGNHALVYKGLDGFPRLLTFTRKTRVFPPMLG